jgi:hypothetical protein
MDAFMACVKGIISNDLNNLVTKARNRYEQKHSGDPDQNPNANEPTDPQEICDLLSREDIHIVFFKKMYERIETQPALLDALTDWEQRFCEDDRVTNGDLNQNHLDRMGQLAREIVHELATKVSTMAKNSSDDIAVSNSDPTNDSGNGLFDDKVFRYTRAEAAAA